MRALEIFIVKSTAGGFHQEIELVVNFCPLCPHTASSDGKCNTFDAEVSGNSHGLLSIYKNSGVLPFVLPSVSWII